MDLVVIIFISFVVSSFFHADNETEEKSLRLSFSKHQPETFGNVGVLFLLLDHQTTLPPHRKHGVHDGQLGDLRVEVLQPELVHSDEGASPSDSGTAVDQNCPCRICGRGVLVF